MKIRFEREERNKASPLEIPVPPAHSTKRDISIGGGGYHQEEQARPVDSSVPDEPILPPPPPPFKKEIPAEAKSVLDDEIKYFQEVYAGVFGSDSLMGKDVIGLNLLFAIYSELVNLRVENRRNERLKAER